VVPVVLESSAVTLLRYVRVLLPGLLVFPTLSSTIAETHLPVPVNQFTNLFYLRRQMEPGERVAWQERAWILNGKFRNLREELVFSENPPATLDKIPEAAWQKAEAGYEMIQTGRDIAVRVRGIFDFGWTHGVSSQTWVATVVSRSELASVTGIGELVSRQGEPLTITNWVNAGSMLAKPSTYFPHVDLQMLKGNASVVWEQDKAIWKAGTQTGITNVVWELEFDPVTQLKRRERLWARSQLISEVRWYTDAMIDPNQFYVSDHDQDKWRQPERTRSVKPARGIGILLKPRESGPFTIEGVLADSAAEKAGIESGEVMTSINGQSTAGMPTILFVTLCTKDDVGTPVIIEVRSPETGERNLYNLRRRKLAFHSAKPTRRPTQ
jgi:PDZ domain